MKHWFLFFLLFIMSYQGILLGQNVSGIFENATRILELRQDGTFYYKVKSGDLIHISPIGGADLISYGQWEKVGRKYVLFSDTTLKGPYLAAHVEESCNSTPDSLYIFISSPFENDKMNDPQKLHNAYIYAIDLYVDEGVISYFSTQKDIRIGLNNNTVSKIKLSILPYDQIYWRDSYYSKLQYEFLPQKSKNVFSLNIPSFTTFYVYYERLYGDEVCIKNDKTILFRGMILTKRK